MIARIGMMLVFGFGSVVGLGADKVQFQGKLETTAPVKLKKNFRTSDIGQGLSTITVQEQGAVFYSHFQIQTPKGSWKVNVPKDAFTSPWDFYAGAGALKQPVAIKGARSLDLLESKEVYGTTPCTAPGVCWYQETYYDGRDWHTRWVYGHYDKCAGTQEVISRVETYADFYRAAFIDPQNAQEIGVFLGRSPKNVQKTVQVRPISDCRLK